MASTPTHTVCEPGDAPVATRAFVSYSRQDVGLVALAFDALKDRRIDAWVDWEGIPPSAEWWKEVCGAIESTDAFLFFMSTASLASPVCMEELDHAVQHHKRLVAVDGGGLQGAAIPDHLRKIQWVSLRQDDGFEEGIARIVEAIETDLVWVRAHTRLLSRALEWDLRQRDMSFLLHRTDLEEAEGWLAKGPDKDPNPTAVQTEYILASRAAATRRQRRLIALGAAALLFIAAGAGAAVIGFAQAARQRDVAEAQTRLAMSRQLAAQATQREAGRGWGRSTLLALAGVTVADTVEARSALLSKISALPLSLGYLWSRQGSVRSVVFSPDGKSLVMAATDGKATLWDVATRRQVGDPLKAHPGLDHGMAIGPDGRLLATLGDDGKTIVLRDLPQRSQNGAALAGHRARILCVAFSPDGRQLASASADGTLRFWDVTTREPLDAPLLAHGKFVSSVAFSPDGKLLASAGDDGTVMLWDAASHGLIGPAMTGHHNAVTSLAFSPDGRWLASASGDETVRLWDVAGHKPHGEPLQGHKSLVTSVAFSPDGKQLASGDRDHSEVILWDLSSHSETRRLSGYQQDGVNSIAFSPDGALLASAAGDGTVVLHAMTGSAPLNTRLPPLQPDVSSVAFGGDGRWLAASGGDMSVVFWDTTAHPPRSERRVAHRSPVLSVAFSSDQRWLASSDDGGTVVLWDAASRQPVSELSSHSGAAWVAFGVGGKVMASVGADGKIVFRDVGKGQALGPPIDAHQGALLHAAFSPDGSTFASAGSDGTVRLWNGADRQPVGAPLKVEKPVHGVAFSPDGKLLATVSDDDTVTLWNLASRQPAGPPLKLRRAAVVGIGFSPDGRTLALASAQVPAAVDNKVSLWDVASRQPLGDLLVPWPVFGIAFSPDGRQLASGGGDGTVTLWDVDEASWRRRACSIVNRNLSREEWRAFAGDIVPYRAVCPDLPEFVEPS